MDSASEFLERRFRIDSDSQEDKRVTLHEAVETYIKPGVLVHSSCAGTIPYGMGYELIRQFEGKKPRFTIAALGATNLVQLLCASELIEGLIDSYAGDVYPRPNVSSVIQRALKKGVRIENWSILSLVSRLAAGATGVEFFPTRSIAGSSMEKENRDSFKIIDDPFGSGRRVGLVKALKPNLPIVHAWCADRSGNAIIVPPLGDSNFAFHASKGGVILSAEKIVSTEFNRRHATMVRVPGHLVKAIVELPFGAHPSSHFGLYGERSELFGWNV